MKIPVSELKAFKSESAHIKPNSSITALQFLRAKDGVLTKNNLTSFVCKEVDGVEGSVLLEEKILTSLLKATKRDQIEIQPNGKSVRLSDGSIELVSPLLPEDNFPSNDQPVDGFQSLPDDIVDAIVTASNFVSPEQTGMFAKDFVFIGKDHVCACSSFIGYIEKVGKAPELVLSKEIAQGMPKSDVQYSENKSYYFFKSGKTTYGFSRPEFRYFDMLVIGRITDGSPSVKVNKWDLISYNALCVECSDKDKTMSVAAVMSDGLSLSFLNTETGVPIKQMLPATGDPSVNFNYRPELMNIVLKNMTGEEIQIIQDGHKIFFKNDDPSKTYLLMAVAELNQKP